MDAAFKLKSVEFRREREASWSELEALVGEVERRGLRSLGPAQLARLPVVYRAALSSLSVARAISLDRNVVDYLDSLCGRAYFCVYGAKRSLVSVVAEFCARGFPRAARALRWHIALSALLLALGTLAGWMLTASDESRFYSFVSADYAQGRGPTSTTAELRDVLYHEQTGAEKLAAFASFLFTHNARIGMLAFALGFAFGLPTFFLVLLQGLILGAFAALYAGRGLALDFWGWILPHGVSELGAVIVCGGAGFVLAQGVVFPGRHTRLENLALRGREAGTLVLGAVGMLFVAGLIEGIFRQTVQSVPARYALAAGTALAWAAYFTLAGRSRS
jgi:uncharacterized membrane protein SpoIIM required for sporulation